MDNFKNNKKIIFIPGWLDVGKRHAYQNSLDPWHNKIKLDQDFKVDYVIAHSIGALLALKNWSLYKNYKIILVNPVISKRNIFIRWYKYIKNEGLPSSFKKTNKIIQATFSLLKLIKLFKIPANDIISDILKDKLFIIFGENDKYLFDKEIAMKLKEKGIFVLKVKDSGHNYDKNLKKLVSEIVVN